VDLDRLLLRLSGLKALVVGDVCLDRWCTYDPELALPSKETGIPRTAVIQQQITAGAGGTIANNLEALGLGQVSLLSTIGVDGNGFDLKRALAAKHIDASLLMESEQIPTFTYTKLMTPAGHENLARVDFVATQPVPPAVEQKLVETFVEHAPWFDVVLISDQAETHNGGLVTDRLREAINRFAAKTQKIVWVDSRERIEKFRHAILKPNEEEANAAAERLNTDWKGLRQTTQARWLVVTRGGRGADLISEQGDVFVQTRPIHDPVDICGAGDSFSAGAASALAAGSDPVSAIQFGNLVASVTVMKKGTGTASPEELREAYAFSRD
jgi:rfaE bifunctional protein kinase chain/domain